jgi:hypothetical protein
MSLRSRLKGSQRIAARLSEREAEQRLEWQFSPDPWSYRLLVALARRYGLRPYRYPRQRRTTVMIRIAERFMRETFLPEYQEMAKALTEHLNAVTERVVAEVLNADRSEPTEVAGEPPGRSSRRLLPRGRPPRPRERQAGPRAPLPLRPAHALCPTPPVPNRRWPPVPALQTPSGRWLH